MTTDDAGRVFTYDAWNRLKSGNTTTFDYDALGRRIATSSSGLQLYYTAAWQVIEERVSASAAAASEKSGKVPCTHLHGGR